MNYKLVVISDVHGDMARLKAILPVINAADYMIFCGDGWQAIQNVHSAIRVPMACVRGNTDFGAQIEDAATIDIGGAKAFITHGHKQGAKQDTGGVLAAAKLNRCSLAFYGHTHIYCDRIEDGVHLICPGALCNGSYAVVVGDGVNFTCERQFI